MDLAKTISIVDPAKLQLLAHQLSPNAKVRANEPLAKKTTLRIGGPADAYIEPATEADLAAVIRFCAEQKWPWRMIGRGSNLLIRDGGIRGVVLSLAQPRFCEIQVSGERLICGAGVKLKQVAMEAKRHGIGGLEFLEGIPGSLGGAMRMNAGAMGGSTFDLIETIRTMDLTGQIVEFPAANIPVVYRSCPLFKTHIALGAVFKGQSAPRESIEAKLNEASRKRWSSQPAAPSAGCIFKNPSTIPAGRLIDELGLKGMRVGGAVVSDVHGNFIVNDGHATARQVLDLIAAIQEKIRAARGIEMETEVEIVGEDK